MKKVKKGGFTTISKPLLHSFSHVAGAGGLPRRNVGIYSTVEEIYPHNYSYWNNPSRTGGSAEADGGCDGVR